jgi:hypothetical protein
VQTPVLRPLPHPGVGARSTSHSSAPADYTGDKFGHDQHLPKIAHAYNEVARSLLQIEAPERQLPFHLVQNGAQFRQERRTARRRYYTVATACQQGITKHLARASQPLGQGGLRQPQHHSGPRGRAFAKNRFDPFDSSESGPRGHSFVVGAAEGRAQGFGLEGYSMPTHRPWRRRMVLTGHRTRNLSTSLISLGVMQRAGG